MSSVGQIQSQPISQNPNNRVAVGNKNKTEAGTEKASPKIESQPAQEVTPNKNQGMLNAHSGITAEFVANLLEQNPYLSKSET